MATSSAELNVVRIPLSSEAHEAAENAYQKQSQVHRKQTYLNVLAVHAVSQYLQWLSIPVDWQGCDSYDSVIRQFMDVADIMIPGYGRLECRPVLPGDDAMAIPSEAQGDRLGYVAVQLDEKLDVATLAGFTTVANQTQILLKDLDPLESLLDIVGDAEAVVETAEDFQGESVPPVVELQRWFNQVFEAGWLAAEEFFLAMPMKLAPSFRGGSSTNFMSTVASNGVIGAKLLEQAGKRMALCVGLSPSVDEAGEIDISVELYPVNSDGMLPEKVTLTVLDASGKTVIESQPVKDVEYQFSGESGEQFSVQVSLQGQDEFSFLETFLI